KASIKEHASFASLRSFLFGSFSQKFLGLIFYGEQKCGQIAVSLRDNPEAIPGICFVGAQEPETMLKAVVVFFAILLIQIAPLAMDVAREEFARPLSRLLAMPLTGLVWGIRARSGSIVQRIVQPKSRSGVRFSGRNFQHKRQRASGL